MIDVGLNCRATAAHFGASASNAIRWQQLALEHGQAVAKPHGGNQHSGEIEAYGDFARKQISEQDEMTLANVQARPSVAPP